MKGHDYFPIERNRYYYGKLLTVRDFEVEQNYFLNKERLDNRVMHGAGVVCGMGVSAGDDATLLIESGMALDYYGRDIIIEEPLVRKLPMIEGYDSLMNSDDAYLCLHYHEEDTEPVNAVGAEAQTSRQFNMTRESYRLSLSAETPEYQRLLESSGEENVNLIYTSDALTIVLTAPSAVCAGEDFEVSALIVKNANTPPVHFVLEGENTFVESENGRVVLEYRQSPTEKRHVVRTEFKLRAQQLSGLTSQLFPAGAELNVELGSHHYKNYISVEAPVTLCADRDALRDLNRVRDNLAKNLTGGDLPIYLAKLELVRSTGGVFLGAVTDLPFDQFIARDSAQGGGRREKLEVSTRVRQLEYWQKPDVRATYNSETETLAFDFGIPSPEQYDYSISHGVVDLEMPGGLRVNSRFYSEEIPHGLGVGAVDVRLSVEFLDGEDTALLIGNSEVFKSKSIKVTPPWVETAALVYPERGTMKIGVWLHDTVSGNRLRIHYFAQKPERDMDRILDQRKVSISVMPEVSRLGRREQLRLKAVVDGSEDKGVIWSVREENGGAIDANGIYQAPEIQGTYEIVATASADPDVQASAYVIVE
ncbi:MAG: hypothetical protein IJC43_01790 [Clostridia bacterium]|nr:hypothetical protein [Clostridia bacterium]